MPDPEKLNSGLSAGAKGNNIVIDTVDHRGEFRSRSPSAGKYQICLSVW
jgi:hypothetical protein